MKWMCELVIGEADSAESAERLAQAFRDCPFSAFVGAFGSNFVWVLFVPEGHLPWLQSLDKQPEALGLRKASVLLTHGDKILYPKCALRLPQEKSLSPPCGANCELCEFYRSQGCPGCPATFLYRENTSRGENVSGSGMDVLGG